MSQKRSCCFENALENKWIFLIKDDYKQEPFHINPFYRRVGRNTTSAFIVVYSITVLKREIAGIFYLPFVFNPIWGNKIFLKFLTVCIQWSQNALWWGLCEEISIPIRSFDLMKQYFLTNCFLTWSLLYLDQFHIFIINTCEASN